MRLAEVVFPVPVDKAFSYEIPAALVERVVPGVRVRASFGPRRLFGVVIRVREGEPPPKVKSLDVVLDGSPFFSKEGLGLLGWLARRYCAPPGECLKLMVPANIRDARRHLEGLVLETDFPEPPPAPPSGFTLTHSQKDAVEKLGALVDKREFSSSLLFGVPASGKTEVYLRLIRRAVAKGGQVLFLVPEISLSRPFFKEFSKSLGLPVALWHSRIGGKKRKEDWAGIRSGRIRAVVGARSAALLPFRDLRLVVMDEEQDESYKQDEQPPYYHARDVVIERAKSFGATVVLGSATPSIEAFAGAGSGEARFPIIRMDERVSKTTDRPPIKIVARKDEFEGCLSEELLAQIKDRIQRSEQVILLVNRRGFSNFMICRKCAWVARCPTCEVAFIHHGAPKSQTPATGSLFGDDDSGFHMRCHHCDCTADVPRQCARCGGPVRFAGVGTQKVVAELKREMPYVKILRMDRDTVAKEKADDESGVYEDFSAGKADVLVGTKLVAKGFHFPKVTLVGVVDADTMINMPDFRAAERTVQLLIQAAGRAGRADRPGEVVLQTAQPEHYAIQAVARGDYAAFAKLEMGYRRELDYPPASTLIRLVFVGKTEKPVIKGSIAAADQLRAKINPDDDVVGPAPGVLAKLHGQVRHHLLLKIKDRARLNATLDAVRALEIPSSVRVKVNVDPYDFF